MAEKTKTGPENKNDALAFIIGGIFILGLVFSTYNYFTNREENGLGEDGQAGRISLEKLKETLSSSTGEEEMDTGEKIAEAVETGEEAVMSWTANDYEDGDIEPGNYNVKSGDTLWEIAEAVYGNGSMWTEILEANADSVGFLPNGQQSLILTGQILNIPAR